MKICEICESEFEIPSLFRSGGYSRIICFTCLPDSLSSKEKAKLRAKLYVQKARSHKESIGCNLCGYNKFGVALDWHHPHSNKDLNPSSLLNNGSYQSYLEETKKCVLLCACCHRAVHSGDISE